MAVKDGSLIKWAEYPHQKMFSYMQEQVHDIIVGIMYLVKVVAGESGL